jgi:Ca2+-binding RTX toxin-like protein
MGRQPCIEKLENRRLMASIALSGGVVSIIGATGQPNTITVGLLPGDSSLYATYSYPTNKGIVSKTKDYPLIPRIRQIKIVGGNKSDVITIDQTNGSFPIATNILTHNGNDTVVGGDEPDRIVCGNGIDSVNSGDGNDTLLAGTGPDTLIGGNGNDQLRSGRGHDTLETGNGDSSFTDPYGNTTLIGGTGHDTYILKSLALDPDNNYSPSKDTLRKYVPPAPADNTLKNILNGLLDSGFF